MLVLASVVRAQGQGQQQAAGLPERITIEFEGKDHVQGMAIDTAARCIFLSMTTTLLKTDYEGRVLERIDSIPGHLGAMTFDHEGRTLYASLEYKDDEIGRGIARHLGREAYRQDQSRFYVAKVSADNFSAPGAMQLFEVTEAIKDYKTRYGCSGIDGVTIAPKIGKKPGERRLYVAYGIYGDTTRTDNDHQILLEYKLSSFKSGKTPKASAKYFIYTGNTTWGVQNLCYDSNTGCIFMACYAGRKSSFPNYSLFALPVAQKPSKAVLKGLVNDGKHLCLKLSEKAPGWYFGAASTGLCSLGDGIWFISSPFRLPSGLQTATVTRYHWRGFDAAVPIVH